MDLKDCSTSPSTAEVIDNDLFQSYRTNVIFYMRTVVHQLSLVSTLLYEKLKTVHQYKFTKTTRLVHGVRFSLYRKYTLAQTNFDIVHEEIGSFAT